MNSIIDYENEMLNDYFKNHQDLKEHLYKSNVVQKCERFIRLCTLSCFFGGEKEVGKYMNYSSCLENEIEKWNEEILTKMYQEKDLYPEGNLRILLIERIYGYCIQTINLGREVLHLKQRDMERGICNGTDAK